MKKLILVIFLSSAFSFHVKAEDKDSVPPKTLDELAYPEDSMERRIKRETVPVVNTQSTTVTYTKQAPVKKEVKVKKDYKKPKEDKDLRLKSH